MGHSEGASPPFRYLPPNQIAPAKPALERAPSLSWRSFLAEAHVAATQSGGAMLAEHPHSDVDRLDHALGIGDALPGAIERGAVVHGDAQERQSHGDVDAREPGPRPRGLVVRETECLHGHVP